MTYPGGDVTCPEGNVSSYWWLRGVRGGERDRENSSIYNWDKNAISKIVDSKGKTKNKNKTIKNKQTKKTVTLITDRYEQEDHTSSNENDLGRLFLKRQTVSWQHFSFQPGTYRSSAQVVPAQPRRYSRYLWRNSTRAIVIIKHWY